MRPSGPLRLGKLKVDGRGTSRVCRREEGPREKKVQTNRPQREGKVSIDV